MYEAVFSVADDAGNELKQTIEIQVKPMNMTKIIADPSLPASDGLWQWDKDALAQVPQRFDCATPMHTKGPKPLPHS